ncbi:MAG: surface-adhesin E family protein [Oxalobacteraceae bacterium]
MTKLLTALSLALMFSAASATEWKLISETEDKDKITSWYVDMTSIVREEEYLRAYLRTSWSSPQYGPDKTPYQSSTYVNYFDCDTGRIAYTANTYFASTEPEGKPVHQEPEQPVTKLKFHRAKPGSAGETRLQFVCKFRSKNFNAQRSVVTHTG